MWHIRFQPSMLPTTLTERSTDHILLRITSMIVHTANCRQVVFIEILLENQSNRS